MNITIDKEFMYDVYSKQCTFCKNLEDAQNRECTAFPDGIPKEIWNNGFDHRNPYPNAEEPEDNDIRFEPVKEGE